MLILPIRVIRVLFFHNAMGERFSVNGRFLEKVFLAADSRR